MKIITIILLVFISISCKKNNGSGFILIGKKDFINNIQNASIKYSFDGNKYKSDNFSLNDGLISGEIIFKVTMKTSNGKDFLITSSGMELDKDPLLKEIKESSKNPVFFLPNRFFRLICKTLTQPLDS